MYSILRIDEYAATITLIESGKTSVLYCLHIAEIDAALKIVLSKKQNALYNVDSRAREFQVNNLLIQQLKQFLAGEANFWRSVVSNTLQNERSIF